MAKIEKIRGRYIQQSYDGGISWRNIGVSYEGFVFEIFEKLGWDTIHCTDTESNAYELHYRLEPLPTKYELELTDSELEDLPDWAKEKLNANNS